MDYWAHSENEKNQKHKLIDHLIGTAEIASSFGRNENEKKYLKIAGLIHDLGKYQDEFQNYLMNGGRRGSVNHTMWGAILSKKWKAISFAIDGHHSGIPDSSIWNNEHTFFGGEFADRKEKVKNLINKMKIDYPKLENQLKMQCNNLDTEQEELYTRYIFSCLTDADWLDTEAHFNSNKSKNRKTSSIDVTKMINEMENYFGRISKEGELNKLRNSAREYAFKKAAGGIGFYSMNLPTGLGKTLTSFYWALSHAQHNSLKRIIVVLPFLNIIDQTAMKLKEIFGEDAVLEHHSSAEFEDDDSYLKLSSENWDYPIIVTTTVQFFETLFSNKPSKSRKLHNIADSIVIFDEVQVLPKKMISPTLTMLKNMNELLGVSCLFCTATMPAFSSKGKFEGLNNIVSLVENAAELFKKTIRVNFQLLESLEKLSYENLLIKVISNGESSLVIFNTKKDALSFFEAANKINDSWDEIYHLSTHMCSAHRKEILQKIKISISNKKRVLVSTTQLVEAGVDIDFPNVYRALAPLESLIQSAGRCNREGKLTNKGNCYIFELSESNSWPDKHYKTYAEFTRTLLTKNISRLNDYDFFTEYYESVIQLFIDPDQYKIDEERKNFNFKTVADSYHIIDSATVPIFIKNYNNESQKIYNKFKWKNGLSKEDYRMIQPYSVQVFPNFIEKNKDWFEKNDKGLFIWSGVYDECTGVKKSLLSEIDLIV